MIDAIRTRLSTTALLLCLSLCIATAAAATKPPNVTSWDALRSMDLEELRADKTNQSSPRHQLMLSLHEVETDIVEATRQLNLALASADPGTDEARLAELLQCSFTELLGTTLDPSECNQHGQEIANMTHPLPAALAQLNFGIWLATNGKYAEAFRANRAAAELALGAGDLLLAATAQNNQGVDYLIRGLPVQALNKFQVALEQVRQANMPDQESFLALLASNIASAHLELGEFESANALVQIAISSEDYDRYNPTNLIDEVILARASLEMGRPQAGYDRLSNVLAAAGQYGVLGVKAYAYSVIGELQIALGNIEQGIDSFGVAQQHAAQTGDPLRVSKVNVYFADALVGQERYDEAEQTIESSISALSESGPSMILAHALDLRGDVLRATGNRAAANSAKRQARQMQAKVVGVEHNLDLAMLGKSLELANQANELANTQEEARQSEARAKRDITLRNQLILSALVLALITYLVLSRRYERKVARTIQTANAELEAKVSERTAALEQEMAQRLGAEGERRLLAQSLAESEKLQAIGQLTSGVAHDFNNLMTVVTLSAGLLKEADQIANSSLVQHVDNILTATDSASDITASLLAYARKQPLTPESTNLESFVLESLPLFESTLGKSIALNTRIEACTILVDRSQLTTAIINLLLNAKEALQGRGRIDLEVAELLQINEQGEPKHWATIAVIDHGQGMSPLELRRATEPFYTTKAVGQGTGLGLSMVDGFAKQSGGFLNIDSTLIKGTAVTLHIPLDASAAISGAPIDKVAPSIPTTGLVLIVDDQKAIRDVLCRLLEQMGLETLSASSGAQALQLLQSEPLPDLLITDHMMPGEINGQQLAAQVRKLHVKLPVLIMSGYTNSIELDVEFLHKPFSFEDLRAAIARTIVHDNAA